MFSGTKQGIKKPLLAVLLLVAVFPVQSAEQRLALSTVEQEWLDSIEVIRLCSDPDWMPYEAIGESGQHIGIMSDFHQLWSEMMGKPVKLQITDSWEQALQYMPPTLLECHSAFYQLSFCHCHPTGSAIYYQPVAVDG